jgi:hypothetical protein
MSQVLAPRLELLWGLANLLAKLDKGISKAMGIKIRQARTYKGFPEDRPNGLCSSVLPAMRAAISAATSSEGHPTARGPRATGFVHSLSEMRRYMVERDSPDSDLTARILSMVRFIFKPPWGVSLATHPRG